MTLDLATVRGYLQVPATLLTDEDLTRMLDACLADQIARCSWGVEPVIGKVTLTVEDMTATVRIVFGDPNETYRALWGDGSKFEVITTDGAGIGEASHEYETPGTYTGTITDNKGTVLKRADVTVPGEGDAPPHYPKALEQALLRRVQREVAARNLPLGMVGLDGAEYGPSSLAAYDALVEQHERAYRTQVVG